MRDIYRELLRRSALDAASIAWSINEEEEHIQVGSEFVSQGAMALYHHRVNKQMMKWQEAKAKQNTFDIPDGDGREMQ